jgi:hypothetical protein
MRVLSSRLLNDSAVLLVLESFVLALFVSLQPECAGVHRTAGPAEHRRSLPVRQCSLHSSSEFCFVVPLTGGFASLLACFIPFVLKVVELCVS